MLYVHPILAGAAVALMLWVGLAGLRSRHPRSYAATERRRHGRFAPWALRGMIVALVTGTASTLWLRPDLDLTESAHLPVGIGAVLSGSAAAWLSRDMYTSDLKRRLHPIVAGLALVLALVQLALGFGRLP